MVSCILVGAGAVSRVATSCTRKNFSEARTSTVVSITAARMRQRRRRPSCPAGASAYAAAKQPVGMQCGIRP
jgi:hypothetical protein